MSAAAKTRSLLAVLALLAVWPASAGASTPAGTASYTVRGSVEQVDVTGAQPGHVLSLVNGRGRRLQARTVDRLGSLIFRGVTPGSGYRVRESFQIQSPPVTVLSTRPAPPSTAGYRQTLPSSGYGYLTTRDGTKLAIDVRLPSGSGPYPTIIEYAGYGYARPSGAQSGISPLLTLLGFAVVDVNMRGTGCSGGAFDYFEPLQSLDGYDVIETVARQPWVLHHRVGMAGISYGGISQLFVGATRPPSLSAIAPLSVIDSTATTLYPGGMLNTGFAFSWAKDRVHDALPASATGGQPWAYQRIQGRDTVCAANQALHSEAVDLIAKIHANRYYVPSIADPVDPVTFVHKIGVPVFLACQFTDEQTGGHCPTLASRFTGTSRKWFTFTNGVHTDSLDPVTMNRWYDFLSLFVARKAPDLSGVKILGPAIFSTVFGISGLGLPDDPIQGRSYSAALAAFKRLGQVRILFDNGAGSSHPGNPLPGFEQSFPRFPAPGTRAASWYLGAGGSLGGLQRHRGADRFRWNPGARPANDFSGDTGSGTNGLWTALPPYRWLTPPAGSAVAYATRPLRSTTTVVGAGAVHLWIRATVPNVDLQATVSEVRPDGKETFVQSGWLRTSGRKLDPAQSTLLEPMPSFRRRDVRPLPGGRWTEVTIPLYYEGHVYRAGSRIRVTISAPGGDQPIWAFALSPSHPTPVAVGYGRRLASRLILPVVAGVRVTTGLPPCPGLRGEPCRTFQRLVNQPARP